MSLLNQTLTANSGSNKSAVKVPVKTPYIVTIMVNNNDMISGTHAGMLLVGPNIFEIFDPNGSFEYPGIASGSMRVFPVYEANQRADVYNKYLEYQLVDGGEVYVYKFYVSQQEFKQIQNRIEYGEGCSGVLNCSKCVSNAVTGIGVFKTLPPDIFLPSNLNKELGKLKSPLKILKNK